MFAGEGCAVMDPLGWADYIDPEVLSEIRVNEAAYTRLEAGLVRRVQEYAERETGLLKRIAELESAIGTG